MPRENATETQLLRVARKTTDNTANISDHEERIEDIENVWEVTSEPTGFKNPESITVTYDSTKRKITLTGTVEAYYKGEHIAALKHGWVSDAHDNTNDTWFLYYDNTGFHWSTTPWGFSEMHIAFVNYGATNKWALHETHGVMQWQTHQELHQQIGTYRQSGGVMSGYTLNSITAAERRPLISGCVIQDEDLPTILSALATESYTRLYLSATETPNLATAENDIVSLSGSRPYWNELSGTYGQTLMDNNSYMSVWLLAIPVASDTGSQAYRYLWVQGQSNSTKVDDIENEDTNSVDLGLFTNLSTEFVYIGKIIIKYTGGDWSLHSVELLKGNRAGQTGASVRGLTSVTSDTTLTGTGITSDPLGTSLLISKYRGVLPSNANFNDYTDNGSWHGGVSTGWSNDPGISYITLVVSKAIYIRQEVQYYNNTAVYSRMWSGSTWSAWRLL